MAPSMIAVFLLCLPVTIESAPIPKHMVDMTYVFNNATLYFPSVRKLEVNVVLNRTVEAGYWMQLEEYSASTHVGTHMDAPCHFARGRWCIDQIPLTHFIAPAAVIDIRHKAERNRDATLEIEDLRKWETETGQTLNGTIVLLLSGWGKRWSNRTAYIGTSTSNRTDNMHYPGFGPKAARWLVDNRRIYGVGTDTLSFDIGPSRDFRSHVTLLGANIYGLENVANVDKIPICGATLYVMPMKIGNSGGAPTRVIATFPEVIFGSTTTESRPENVLREVIVFS